MWSHTHHLTEQLQNESPELLYSWQAAHYRRNTENLTFLHSVQSDQLLKRRTKRNTFYFWFCFQSGFNATNCIDIQSFLHVSIECLLVADGSFYMLAELDLSLSGVGIILQNMKLVQKSKVISITWCTAHMYINIQYVHIQFSPHKVFLQTAVTVWTRDRSWSCSAHSEWWNNRTLWQQLILLWDGHIFSFTAVSPADLQLQLF